MLWSVPRSTSTAFERAFIQRKDTSVLHEPFGEPFYYGPERLSKRYSDDKCARSDARDVKYSDIHQLILHTQAKSKDKLVVVKDMAQYVVPPELIDIEPGSNPSVLSAEDLKKFRHTFLIRTPEKTIPSYYRATTTADCADFGAFDPSEAGFMELRALLDYTYRLLPEDPIVLLDSSDLIAKPEGALRAFCSAVDIPFDEKMLSWENRRVESFDKWKGFHDQAQNSTGFKEISHAEMELPGMVTDAIDANMPTYLYLRELRLKV